MSIKRLLSTLAVGAAMVGASGVASAALLPFCVNDSAFQAIYAPGTFGNQTSCAGVGPNAGRTGFTADQFTGSYTEKLVVTSLSTPTSGTFSAVILLDINSYNYLGTTVQSLLNIPTIGYDVYAVVQASGNFAGGSFNATSATLNIWADPGDNTTIGQSSINNNLTLNGIGAAGGDTLLATSSLLLSGTGSNGANGAADGYAVTFGQLSLTPAGQSFFIAPYPFYLSVYSDGDVDDFAVGGVGSVVELQGQASANFLLVPEPGSLALAGLALVGLGAVRRRKAS